MNQRMYLQGMKSHTEYLTFNLPTRIFDITEDFVIFALCRA